MQYSAFNACGRTVRLQRPAPIASANVAVLVTRRPETILRTGGWSPARSGIRHRQVVPGFQQCPTSSRPAVDFGSSKGVEICFNCHVTGIEPDHGSKEWQLRLRDGEPLRARTVIVASGGLSVPATGSDGIGLAWARQLGHRVHPTYPALTPLTQNPARHAPLAGVSLEVTLTAPSWTEGFSHSGRIPVHTSRLQRPSITEHLASCSPVSASGRTAAADFRAVGQAGGAGME